MMDMMERMMGKEPGEKGEQPGGKGEKPGEQAGKGQTGLSDAANEATGGAAAGSSETPRSQRPPAPPDAKSPRNSNAPSMPTTAAQEKIK
jgi:hypothetical protein